mgnify:CR=1 FL=1
MKITKPKPSQYYDIHEVTEYMNKKFGFTDEDWDELIDNFADMLSQGCILTLLGEDDNKLEEAIIKEFGGEDEQVNLHYWW